MLDQFEAARNRGAIAIDADDARLRRLEDGPAVAAGAEGGVDINPAVARPQPGEHLAAEYRNMARTRGRLGHGASTTSFLPAVPGSPAFRPAEFVPSGARFAPSVASSLAKLGFERTRQTYASRTPSAAGGSRSDPEAHLLCINLKPVVPAGPKPG